MKSEAKLLKEFQEYRLFGRGDSPKTVGSKLRAILIFREFIKKPVGDFKKDDATQFKNYLQQKRKLGIRTVYSYLFYLEQFYNWLIGEPGYSSKIRRNDIDFFSLTRAEKAIVNSSSPKEYPDLEYTLKLHDSIPSDTGIGLRERALVATAYCTGLRAQTIITLTLGSIDENLFIYQDPSKGIKTKFSKKNITLTFNFHQRLTQSIKDWINLLRIKGFGDMDPLFPKFMPIVETGQEFLFQELKEPTKSFLSDSNSLNQIFRRRSKAAGLEYKHPHLFRHSFFASGEQFCWNGRQFKALSQSGSHKSIITTKNVYADLPEDELKNELSKINDNISNQDDSNMDKQDLLDYIEELKEKIKTGKRNKNF